MYCAAMTKIKNPDTFMMTDGRAEWHQIIFIIAY